MATALVTILALLLALPLTAGAAGELCLRCHPAHYAERGECRNCHRGNRAAGRKELAHQRLIRGRHARFTLGDVAEVREGRELLDRFACRRCHKVGGQGNRLAADLDRIVPLRTGDELSTAIRQPAAGMPDFNCSERQRDLLVNALYAAAAGSGPQLRQPELVRFRASGDQRQDLFSRRCGPCHRVISQALGALGRGRTGPDLSGLFTPFYPASFGTGERWNEEKLGRWLRSPRAVRPWSRMRPVMLTGEESAELVSLLGGVAGIEGKNK